MITEKDITQVKKLLALVSGKMTMSGLAVVKVDDVIEILETLKEDSSE